MRNKHEIPKSKLVLKEECRFRDHMTKIFKFLTSLARKFLDACPVELVGAERAAPPKNSAEAAESKVYTRTLPAVLV